MSKMVTNFLIEITDLKVFIERNTLKVKSFVNRELVLSGYISECNPFV